MPRIIWKCTVNLTDMVRYVSTSTPVINRRAVAMMMGIDEALLNTEQMVSSTRQEMERLTNEIRVLKGLVSDTSVHYVAHGNVDIINLPDDFEFYQNRITELENTLKRMVV